ncbi:MAG: acyl carrier protein [Candidatus Hermodarchaeota archaeon]
MSLIEEFIDILTEVFEIERDIAMDDDITPDDIENWSSITHMEIVSRFEQAFAIEFDVEDITEMDSFGAMKDVLRQYGVDV